MSKTVVAWLEMEMGTLMANLRRAASESSFT